MSKIRRLKKYLAIRQNYLKRIKAKLAQTSYLKKEYDIIYEIKRIERGVDNIKTEIINLN